MDSLILMPKSFIICFIHRTCVQQETDAMYSALAIDNDTESYFLLCHEIRLSPRKRAPPLVLFLSSTHPTQSASK